MATLTYLDVCYLTLFSVLLLKSGIVVTADCVGTGPCSCKFENGMSIDLTPLSSSDVNNPTYMDVSGPGTLDIYSWNPCADFTEGPDNCQNVAVCNIHQNIPNAVYFSLGTTASVSFTTDDLNQVTISYKYLGAGTPTVERNSHILLTCDQTQEGTFVVQGPEPDPTSPDYYFALTSKYACLGNTPSSGGGGGGSGGMSAGTIICIAVFVLAVVYVIVGVSFNAFYRKHIGIERIPNISFWSSVPGLIKDGCKFIITRGAKSTAYDKI